MKELIRMRHLQLRNGLSLGEIAKKSKAIMDRLFSLPEFEKSRTVLFYASFGSEVDTYKMMEEALRQGKTVCVPVTSFKDKTIEISGIASLSDLEKKPSGLIEPKKINPVDLEKIDIVIVPGIAFDLDGYRIGYGGGFYDKLLRKAPRRIISIGLCFEQNLEQRLPRQSHDAKMNKIITEKRVIEVGG